MSRLLLLRVKKTDWPGGQLCYPTYESKLRNRSSAAQQKKTGTLLFGITKSFTLKLETTSALPKFAMKMVNVQLALRHSEI